MALSISSSVRRVKSDVEAFEDSVFDAVVVSATVVSLLAVSEDLFPEQAAKVATDKSTRLVARSFFIMIS